MLQHYALGAMLMLFVATAHAHGAGDHDDGSPIDRNEAVTRADQVVALLVKRAKLRPSWRGVRASDATTRQTPEGLTLWVVAYENPAETSKAARTLYVFVDQFGNFEGSSNTTTLDRRQAGRPGK